MFHHLPAVCQGSKYYHPKQYITRYSVEIPQNLPYICICLILPCAMGSTLKRMEPTQTFAHSLRTSPSDSNPPPGHSFFLAFARTIQSTQSRIVGDHVGFTIGRLHLLQNSLEWFLVSMARQMLVVEPTALEKYEANGPLPGIRGNLFLKIETTTYNWCFCYSFPNSGEGRKHPCLGIKWEFQMPF